MRRERFVHQPFPRIQLEQHGDRLVVQIDEAGAVAVPAEVVDHDRAGLDPGGLGGIAQIRRRDRIFAGAVGDMGEQHARRQQRRDVNPFRDEHVVQAGELVELREAFLLPAPLHDGRLEQRRRRVAVELEQLGRALAVIAKVETAIVERRGFGIPRIADRLVEGARDAEAVEQRLVVDDRLAGEQQQAIELGGSRLELGDLRAGEGVIGAFEPVWIAGRGVPDQPVRLDLCAPVGPRGDVAPDHSPAPPWPPPKPLADAPKPPREIAVARVIAAAAGARK